jgi:hypothetical protein
MTEHPTLAHDVLMILEGFPLTFDDMSQVQLRVLGNTVSAAASRDLPLIIRFLENTTDDLNALSNIDALRKCVVVGESAGDDGLIFRCDVGGRAREAALHFNGAFSIAYMS